MKNRLEGYFKQIEERARDASRPTEGEASQPAPTQVKLKESIPHREVEPSSSDTRTSPATQDQRAKNCVGSCFLVAGLALTSVACLNPRHGDANLSFMGAIGITLGLFILTFPEK